MGVKVQLRRGTTAEHSTFTGAVGEVTVDTTKDTVVVHDGTTASGHPLSRLPAVEVLTGYTIAGTAALPAATDTINQAIGKLSKQLTPSGILKSNGTVLSAAVDGTDYLSPTTQFGTLRLDGDSFGVLGPTGKLFIDRFVQQRGYALTNASVGGTGCADVWTKIVDEITLPSSYGTHMLNIGFNDVRQWGETDYQEFEVANRIVHIVKYLQLNSITDYSDGGITYSGTWATVPSIPESILGVSKYTAEQGAYVSFAFTGTKLSIGTFTVKAAETIAEILIEIDGETYDTYAAPAWTGFYAYGQHIIEISGLSAGSHTCKLTKSDAGETNLFFDWWGVKSESPPKIIVNGLTRMKESSYYYGSGSAYNYGNDSAINAANVAIREALAINFGGDVIFIDQSNFDPNNFELIDTDNVHPNEFGHAWIADNILRYGADMNIPPNVNPLSALYENSWTDFDAGAEWQDGSYSKSIDGTVRLSGMISSGTTSTNTVLFTLPIGYRPARREMFGCACDSGFAILTVKADGAVTAFTGVSNTYLSLSGIVFSAA